ncbi:MAG: hypothetical protein R3B70_17740 [Polyangiaceae bacterium]
MFFLVSEKAPAGIVWEEGWHPGVALDYANDLGAHVSDFTKYPMLEAVRPNRRRDRAPDRR